MTEGATCAAPIAVVRQETSAGAVKAGVKAEANKHKRRSHSAMLYSIMASARRGSQGGGGGG